MGFDIQLKICPAKLTDDCIKYGTCNHQSVGESYISSNFDKFKDIWHIGHSHGHKCSTVSKQLHTAIKSMESNGVKAIIPYGTDGWDALPSVFLVHLIRIKTLVDKFGPATFLSYSHCEIKSSEFDDDTSVYYDHPTEGKQLIDTFAKASVVYTTMILETDPRAKMWLAIAQTMID